MTFPPPAAEVAGLPATGPATEATVRDDLRLGAGDDTEYVTNVVDAVNDLVRHLPIAATAVAEPAATEWPPAIERGANMLAARLYRRRNSPGGFESFADLGPVYVTRNDPDLAQLLALGSHTYPAVG